MRMLEDEEERGAINLLSSPFSLSLSLFPTRDIHTAFSYIESINQCRITDSAHDTTLDIG